MTLKALSDFKYDLEYYTKVQGFIYELIRNSGYEYLHDKKGFKFFNFSNVFPLSPDLKISEGDVKKLIISSPDYLFIEVVFRRLKSIKKEGGLVKFGEMEFTIKDIRKFNVKLDRTPLELYTATPAVIRIHRKYFSLYGINLDKDYIYWRSMYGIRSFMDMARLNLIKKFKEFYGRPPKTTNVFQHIRMRKSDIVTYVKFDNGRYPVIGSLWTFIYNELSSDLLEILRFMVDVGIGERNSLGYGFINPKTY